MDDIESLLEQLRILYAGLAQLKLMVGPEMLLPGRVERYQQTLKETLAAYQQVQSQIEDLDQQLQREQQRLDKGIAQYGPRKGEHS